MSGEVQILYLIAEYERVKQELDKVPVYKGYDDFSRRKNEAERERILGAIKRRENEIRKAVHDQHPMLATPDIDILILRVKTHVEPPEPEVQGWTFNPAR